jgi:hypothetical protein
MTYAGQALATRSKNFFIGGDGKPYYYAHYETIEDSCKDFKKWFDKSRMNLYNILSPFDSINSVSEWVAYLKSKNYFEADESEYYRGVNYFYRKYFTA